MKRRKAIKSVGAGVVTASSLGAVTGSVIGDPDDEDDEEPVEPEDNGLLTNASVTLDKYEVGAGETVTATFEWELKTPTFVEIFNVEGHVPQMGILEPETRVEPFSPDKEWKSSSGKDRTGHYSYLWGRYDRLTTNGTYTMEAQFETIKGGGERDVPILAGANNGYSRKPGDFTEATLTITE